MTTPGSMRYSLSEVLSGMLASMEGDEFPDDATQVAAAFENLASQFTLFAPMGAGVDPQAVSGVLAEMERKAILEALGKTGFNRTAAAKLLGITFRQLRYRMQRLGITDESR